MAYWNEDPFSRVLTKVADAVTLQKYNQWKLSLHGQELGHAES